VILRFNLTLTLLLLFSSPAFARPEVQFASVGGIQSKLINVIDRSAFTIDLAMFEFNARALVDALQRASKRGVQVRVLVDQHTVGSLRQAASSSLGINMEWRARSGRGSRRRGMMHHKFAIFDQARVATGSYNWSEGAEHLNHENILLEDDALVVRSYAGQFEELWKTAKRIKGFSKQRILRERRGRHE
jgi:mitochondrial cardiolipin hydrolase